MGGTREKSLVSDVLTNYLVIFKYYLNFLTASCFLHNVHLACGEVMAAITDLKYAVENSPDYEVDGYDDLFLDEFIAKDVIALIWVIVNKLRASPQQQETFHHILESFQSLEDLQLLCDVATCWSSTLLMIDRALYLHPVIDEFILQSKELEQYKLSDAEWKQVELYRDILQIPHAFQQKLSTEKTPTLCYALPFFQSVITNWEKMKVEHPELRCIINPAIAKPTTYQYRIGDIPAYALAMGVYLLYFSIVLSKSLYLLAIHPLLKFNWIRKNMPDQLD
ncbi:hypothetical protein BT96DRAFT_837968 [Gymnopus androsaceus JB14]|uniref:Uncharacterized protein n=1 Tax=Gymnopus androsaceus JB14 TaxID=1447944 RepID=A0A6A4GPU8_9AGAR|nr:hypothetical protein BT96DRAFT_837968 [Gymnopus androsaceus JB14]